MAQSLSPLIFEYSGRAEISAPDQNAFPEILSFLNGEAETVALDIQREIQRSLTRVFPFTVELRAEIRFYEGSIEWHGLVSLLQWMGVIGGALELVERIAHIIRIAVDHVIRMWLGRIRVNVQSIDIEVIGPGVRIGGWRPQPSPILTWLNDNLGLLHVVWILVTVGSVFVAWITLRQLYATSQEPQLTIDSSTVSCSGAPPDSSDYVQNVGPFIPASYTVRTCRIPIHNRVAAATDVHLYVSLDETPKLLIRRVGTYSSLSSTPSGWGPPLSSLRWDVRKPSEQVEPRNVEVAIGRMLAGETIYVRLDVAYDKSSYKKVDCRQNLYLYAHAREVSKIGKAVETRASLCP